MEVMALGWKVCLFHFSGNLYTCIEKGTARVKRLLSLNSKTNNLSPDGLTIHLCIPILPYLYVCINHKTFVWKDLYYFASQMIIPGLSLLTLEFTHFKAFENSL